MQSIIFKTEVRHKKKIRETFLSGKIELKYKGKTIRGFFGVPVGIFFSIFCMLYEEKSGKPVFSNRRFERNNPFLLQSFKTAF
jgi:hypothetical protein